MRAVGRGARCVSDMEMAPRVFEGMRGGIGKYDEQHVEYAEYVAGGIPETGFGRMWVL